MYRTLLGIVFLIILGLTLNCCEGNDTFDQIKTKIHPIVLKHVKDSSNISLQNSPNLNNSISYHQIDFSNKEKGILQAEFDKGTVIDIWAGKSLGIVYKTDRKATIKRHLLKVRGFFYCSGDPQGSMFFRRYEHDGIFTPVEENWYRFEYTGND